MKLSYEQYLLSNLLKLYDSRFNSQPYDVQFDSIPAIYKHFENSPFNVGTKGVYECMIDYLKFRFENNEFL